MPIIQTTPPAAEPLGLATVKAHLRITHAEEDTTLTRLVSAARREVERRAGLCLISQGWSVFSDGWPADGCIALPLHPVAAITALTIHGEDDTPATIEASHYFLDRVRRPARLVMRQGRWLPPPGRAANGIEVALTAGFGATEADVPEDLRQAMLMLIAHWYAERGDEGRKALPMPALALLEPWRAVRL
jgi:uncharacterized phiE125 gp8 family phage protein